MVNFNHSTQKVVAGIAAILLSGVITVVLFGSLFHYLWVTWGLDPFYKHGFWIALLSILLYGKFLGSLRLAALRASTLFPLDRSNIRAAITAFLTFVIFFVMGIQTRVPWFGGVALFSWFLALHFLFFELKLWKKFSFPLGYFLLAVPLPYLSEFSGLLQIEIARISQHVFSFFNFPLTQEGILLSFPKASFEIAADCTGIKSWLVLLSLSIFFLYFLKLSVWAKMAAAFLIIPIAFISNLLRVFVLLLFGFYQGQDAAMRYWHDFSGVAFYAIACVFVLFLLLFMRRYGSSK
ncbi:MAG: exosortase/archaeosortase family protein [Deltaproteobacteria bacterium]|nr:exosortase/archaeosortase family protein [Deltaproteobacteria bacterium]